jgi:hypothetical protein
LWMGLLELLEVLGEVGGKGRRGMVGIAWRGVELCAYGFVWCEPATDVAVVKLLRREVLRVMMPSLGGGATLIRGDSSTGDGESMILRLMSSARWSDSTISLTFVFLVYFCSKMRRTVRVTVHM